MQKIYYTASVTIDNDCCLCVMGPKFQRHFKSYEAAKEAIDKDFKSRSTKDLTRQYKDGSKVILSFAQLHNLQYDIEKHVDEITNPFTQLHIGGYEETKSNYEESINL